MSQLSRVQNNNQPSDLLSSNLYYYRNIGANLKDENYVNNNRVATTVKDIEAYQIMDKMEELLGDGIFEDLYNEQDRLSETFAQ